MYPSLSVAFLAALSTLATAHPHRHAHLHSARRDVVSLDSENALIPRDAVFFKSEQLAAPPPPTSDVTAGPAAIISDVDTDSHSPAAPPIVPAPVPAPVPVVEPASPSPVTNPVSSPAGYVPFCPVSRRATTANIAYKGNTGSVWGCNMMTIDGAAASLYPYTAEFTSTGETFSCACFNKMGPDGGLDGFWHTAVAITVTAGQSVWMAFDTDTQGACACGPGPGSPLKTPIGQWSNTWCEFDWGDIANQKNSGADVSVLVAGAYNQPYVGMQLSLDGKVCSMVKSTGQNFHAYMPGMEAVDGVGCTGYLTGSLKVVLGD